jgi:hypothetical protein
MRKYFSSVTITAGNNLSVSGSILGVNLTTNASTTGNLNVSTSSTMNSLAITSLTVPNINVNTLKVQNIIIPVYTSGSLTLTNNSNTIGSIITTGGNVGINTSTPRSRLVIGSGATNANLAIGAEQGVHDGYTHISFNGGYDGTEYRFNTTKNRWRINCDQRSTSDYMSIDTWDGTTWKGPLIFHTSGNISTSYSLRAATPSWSLYTQQSGGPFNAIRVITYNTQHISSRFCTVNASSGTVTCTVAGRYLVTFSGFGQFDTSTSLQVWLRKNGANIGRSFTSSKIASTYGPTLSLMVILDLAVNDYLDLYLDVGSLHDNDSVYFTGYMIS